MFSFRCFSVMLDQLGERFNASMCNTAMLNQHSTIAQMLCSERLSLQTRKILFWKPENERLEGTNFCFYWLESKFVSVFHCKSVSAVGRLCRLIQTSGARDCLLKSITLQHRIQDKVKQTVVQTIIAIRRT